MKKLLLVIAVFSLITLSAEAQRAGRPQGKMSPEKIAERMTERMAEALSLSEDQKKAVYALHLERATSRVEERINQGKKMKADHKAEQEKLKAILTPEQNAQWEKRKSEVREKRIQPGDGKRKNDGPKRRNLKQKEEAG